MVNNFEQHTVLGANLGNVSTTHFAVIKKQKFKLKYSKQYNIFWKKAIARDSSSEQRFLEHSSWGAH